MGTRPITTASRGGTALALIGLTAASLCLALLAAPASAILSYASPQTLSAAGQDAFRPQVAIDGSEQATITWYRSDGTNDRIESVRLAADGTPETVKTLSDPGQNASFPQVAIDGSERATITWERSDGSKVRIQSVRLAADGTPETVKTLSDSGENASVPQIAIDGSEQATITWYRFDGSNFRVQSVRLAADGSPGPVQTLSAAGQNAFDPQVAIDGSGRATITWYRSDGTNTRIQSVRLGADGSPGPIRTLSAAGQNALRPQVAIDGSERATITWYRSDGTNDRIESVRLAADGSPGPVQTLSAAGQDAFGPQVAIDGSERATLTWRRSDGTNDRIESVRLAADGSPGPVQTLSAAGQSAFDPQVAIDGSERATITWYRSDGTNTRIQSVRLAANGSPGPVQTVSEAGGNADSPQVAIDGSGRATIAWYRSDGTNNRIQSVRANEVDTKLEGSASAQKKQKQKGKKIAVKAKVKAEEDLDAKVTGKVKVKKKSYKLKSQTKSISSGTSKTLKLKPKKSKDAKKIAKALKKRKKAKAKLKVKLSDEAGNAETTKLAVKLKR